MTIEMNSGLVSTVGIPGTNENGSLYWHELESALELVLQVRDREVRDELEKRSLNGERELYALDALKIGVLALRQAQTRVDVDQIRSEGDRLVEQVRGALDRHQAEVGRGLSDGLKEYFDPESGRFNERVKRLIEKDGELEQLMRRQVGHEGSALAETLRAYMAPTSPLLRALDASSPTGFLAALQGAVATSLSEQQEKVLREFSLDNKEGALCRLVEELTERHGVVEKALERSIADVVAEFSLDRDDSALSRLVGRVERAQKQISSEFSLDAEGSALARMRSELVGVIESLREKNEVFQRDVLEQLTKIAGNRTYEDSTPRHGRTFEDALYDEMLRRAQFSGDVVEHTGNTTGLVRSCKKGDVVLQLSAEHTAAGARIVLEAKEASGFTLKAALEELETARKNRGASIGLFVFSSRTAPVGLEPVARYGSDIVVTWHPDESGSSANLLAGLAIAKALAVRETASGASEADFAAIEKAILEVEKQCKGFDEINTAAQTVRSGADRIIHRAGIMKDTLKKEIATLSTKVGELKAHLTDAA